MLREGYPQNPCKSLVTKTEKLHDKKGVSVLKTDACDQKIYKKRSKEERGTKMELEERDTASKSSTRYGLVR